MTLEAKLASGKHQIKSQLHSIDGKKVTIRTGDEMTRIVNELENEKFVVKSITRRERKRQPTAPYTTSKLQQDAANKMGFTSQKTMMVAQQLYEGIEIGEDGITGLITYMRTDSTRKSPAALEQVRNYIQTQIGEEFLRGSRAYLPISLSPGCP